MSFFQRGKAWGSLGDASWHTSPDTSKTRQLCPLLGSWWKCLLKSEEWTWMQPPPNKLPEPLAGFFFFFFLQQKHQLLWKPCDCLRQRAAKLSDRKKQLLSHIDSSQPVAFGICTARKTAVPSLQASGNSESISLHVEKVYVHERSGKYDFQPSHPTNASAEAIYRVNLPTPLTFITCLYAE